MRVPLKVDVIRDRGALAREAEDGRIENTFRLQVMNTSERGQAFALSAERPAGTADRLGADLRTAGRLDALGPGAAAGPPGGHSAGLEQDQ